MSLGVKKDGLEVVCPNSSGQKRSVSRRTPILVIDPESSVI